MTEKPEFHIETAHLKLRSGRRHLEQIKSRLAQYAADRTFVPVIEKDANAQLQQVRVIQQRPIDLNELSLMAGDCVHNLKSALDHAVVYAARHVGMWSRFTSFKLPTGDNKVNFESQCKGMFKEVDWFAKEMTTGQFYLGGKGEYFYQLTQLDNADKHHSIISVLRGHTHPEITATGPNGFLYMDGNVVFGERLEDIVWASAPLNAEISINNECGLKPLVFIDNGMEVEMVELLRRFEDLSKQFVAHLEKILKAGGHMRFPDDYIARAFPKQRKRG